MIISCPGPGRKLEDNSLWLDAKLYAIRVERCNNMQEMSNLIDQMKKILHEIDDGDSW